MSKIHNIFFITAITMLLITSCGLKKTAHVMPGTWVTDELMYVYTDTTIVTGSMNLKWVFDGVHYQSYEQDTLKENGTYTVSLNGSKITFYTANGNSHVTVLETQDDFMIWHTQNLGNGMVIRIELNKL